MCKILVWSMTYAPMVYKCVHLLVILMSTDSAFLYFSINIFLKKQKAGNKWSLR